ncbi:MAG: metal ABC transporter solute-binding protein, Zn/Mn family [Planctomycetia bacterium]|jgi:manganese/zinc/iron transport system substrate-binding protein
MLFGFSKLGLLSLAFVALAARSAAEAAPPDDGKPVVVATTTVVADLVREVAGDRVVIDSLMAAGIDPHSYKATPRDADRLARADLVVASGLHLEGKLAELLARLAKRVPVVAVADTLPADRLLEADAGLHDPHVWFDAKLWSLCSAVVAKALAGIDADHAAEYTARAAGYAARLERLDDELRHRIATIPADRRVLVTAHDAFRYFGRAYGIEVVGVQGTSTESEAGLRDINRLVDLVVERRIPAVFLETSVSDRSVAALREGAKARGHDVRLGGRLHSDSLGEPGAPAGSLEGALRENVETIVAALAGGR